MTGPAARSRPEAERPGRLWEGRWRAGAVFLACLVAAPLNAGQGAEAKRKELDRVQKELQETRQDIEKFRKLGQTLRHDADRLEDAADRAREKLSAIQGDLNRAEDKKRSLRTRLGALHEAEEMWRSMISAEAAEYLAARSGGEGDFSTEGLWKERFRRAAIVEKGTLLAALGGAAARTSLQEAETLAVERKLSAVKGKVSQEKLRTEAEFKGKKAQVEDLKEKTQAAIDRAQELAESAKALQRMIEAIAKLSRVASPGGAPRIARNSLPWPAQGRVTSRFGKEKDPKTGSWVINQGVRIETGGGPVRAVAAGSVIFAGPFRSYGRVLIANHGEFFGVYGELGETLKTKGDKVLEGEAIGSAAERLYFEIRSGTEALDPLQWLDKR